MHPSNRFDPLSVYALFPKKVPKKDLYKRLLSVAINFIYKGKKLCTMVQFLQFLFIYQVGKNYEKRRIIQCFNFFSDPIPQKNDF